MHNFYFLDGVADFNTHLLYSSSNVTINNYTRGTPVVAIDTVTHKLTRQINRTGYLMVVVVGVLKGSNGNSVHVCS